MVACSVLGAIALVVGLVALFRGQPYAVWYPLVLLGAISGVVFGGLFPVARSGYTHRELQRMQAEDTV